jgi:two-component system nitrogen regulation sensor histidine kinase NtrY
VGFKLKSFRQLNLIFAVFALVLGTALVIWGLSGTHAYRFEAISGAAFNQYTMHLVYVDLDLDGRSESIDYTPKSDDFGLFPMHVYDSNGKLINRFNIGEYYHENWRFFADYDGDDFRDIIVVTRGNDSLFLYVIDAVKKSFIIERQFLLRAPQHYPYKFWDASVSDLHLLDTDKDGHQELLFYVFTGFAQKPRSLYIYEPHSDSILHRFDTAAGSMQFELADLDGDGETEIIAGSLASGNIDDPGILYNDMNGWLFAFNQQLEPIFQPLALSEYPGSARFAILRKNDNPVIAAISGYWGRASKNANMFLINPKGTVLQKEKLAGALPGKIRASHTQDAFIIMGRNGGLFKVDNGLSIRAQNTDHIFKQFKLFPKTRNNATIAFYATKEDQLYLLDNDLSVLGYWQAREKIASPSLHFSDRSSLPAIRLNGQSLGGEELRITRSYFHDYWILYWLAATAIIWIVLLGLHRLFAIIAVFWGFFFSHIRTSRNGLLILDGHAKIVYFNTRLLELLNLAQKKQRRTVLEDMLYDRPEIQQWLTAAIAAKKPFEKNYTLTHNDSQMQLRLYFNYVFQWLGLYYGYKFEVEDLSQPIQSDRLKTWSKGVQKIAHDIKTPLSTIALNIKSLQTRIGQQNNDEQQDLLEDLAIMHTELERIRVLSREFLKFADLDKPRIVSFNLVDCIIEAVAPFADYERRGLTIEKSIAIPNATAQGDPNQIKMLLHILVENAIDAVKGKGHIIIELERADAIFADGRQMIQLSVSDNGPGMSRNDLDRIFEPHFTTKKDGTGMGLAIARKIARDHCSELSVYSKPRMGASFRFHLPLQ